MRFRTSLSSRSHLSQFQHSWCQPTDETVVSVCSNNLESSQNQSSALLWDTKCPNRSVLEGKTKLKSPSLHFLALLFRCPVTTAAESCEEQCDVSLSVACQPKMPLLQLGSPFQMGDYHLTGNQEREKSNGERGRGGVKAIQREVFQTGATISPATCSSEGLGGLPRAVLWLELRV